MATIRLPSGLMSSLSMLTVPLRGPVKARLTSPESAPGDRVDGGQGAAGYAVGGLEGAADVEAAAADGHVLDPGVGLALEGGDPGAVAEAQLDQALLGGPVD